MMLFGLKVIPHPEPIVLTDKGDLDVGGTIDAITTTLIHRAQGGEESAWEKLVYVYSPLVYIWCRKKLPQAADAENVSGEVFLALAKGIGKFRGRAPAFCAWMQEVTRFKIADFWRNKERQPAVMDGSDGERQMDAKEANTRRQDDAQDLTEEEVRVVLPRLVESIRSEFKPKTWDAYYETAVMGRKAAEVAADLEISQNAVFLAKSRVLRRLREEYGDRQEGEDGDTPPT